MKRGLWSFSGGTGFLIGGSHILTSAHVLHRKIDFLGISVFRSAIAAVILFGFSSEKSSGKKIFPFAPIVQKRTSAFKVPLEWKNHIRGANDEPSRFDYGLISLKGSALCSPRFLGTSDIYPKGFWGKKDSLNRIAAAVKGFRYSKLLGADVQLAGYPGDFPCMQWTSSGKLTGIAYGGRKKGRPHYKGTARHDFLTYDIDSASGMSGSPVWGRMNFRRKGGTLHEERVLIGVHSRCGQATAVTPFVWEKHLKNWMKNT
jgi:hypothetical protein